MGLPLEHGLQSTLFAVRLARGAGAGEDAVRDAYYLCLLFHAGCMTDAHVAAQIFGGDLVEHQVPVMHGSPREGFGGVCARCRIPRRRLRHARCSWPPACPGPCACSSRT